MRNENLYDPHPRVTSGDRFAAWLFRETMYI
jgi:hypothetical protein